MTEKELHEYLIAEYPQENISCEWKEMKNLKNSFANDEHKDVISYVSGISNMEGGVLVIGVVDGSLDIVGTDLSKFSHSHISAVPKLVELCPNLPSEGLYIEEFVTDDTGKVVWVVHIPRHSPRKPVSAHKKYWQRLGDSLIHLTKEREDFILNEDIISYHDWSAEIVENATLHDLDDMAIEVALNGYCEKFPHRAKEARGWSVDTFLDKARLTISGKITKTALLLLGKEESVPLLNHIGQMVWRLHTAEERAAKIFYPPFLLSTIKLRDEIRNYQIKIFPRNALLPADVQKYDEQSILEALHNCILHQDYKMNERIVVAEYPDKIVFSNAGAFYEGKYEDYIQGDVTPRSYRNQFLSMAMINLKMIDSQGFGIHDMFKSQKDRYLPLPDYDKSTKNHVVLEIPGQVISKEYSELLMEDESIDLLTVYLLDRVQKGKSLPPESIRLLKKKKLIEGRKPNFYVSKRIAKITHREAEYTKLKGLNDDFYKKMIITALKQHGPQNTQFFRDLLYDKLPESLSESQKNDKVKNMLAALRRHEKIISKNQQWILIVE